MPVTALVPAQTFLHVTPSVPGEPLDPCHTLSHLSHPLRISHPSQFHTFTVPFTPLSACYTRVLFRSGDGWSSPSVSRDRCRGNALLLRGMGGAAVAPLRELVSDMAVSESDTTLGGAGRGEEVRMAPSVSEPSGSPTCTPVSTEERSVGMLRREL